MLELDIFLWCCTAAYIWCTSVKVQALASQVGDILLHICSGFHGSHRTGSAELTLFDISILGSETRTLSDRLDSCTQTDYDEAVDTPNGSDFLCEIRAGRKRLPPCPSTEPPVPPMVLRLDDLLPKITISLHDTILTNTQHRTRSLSAGSDFVNSHPDCTVMQTDTSPSMGRQTEPFWSRITATFEHQLVETQKAICASMHERLEELIRKQNAREDRLASQIAELTNHQHCLAKDTSLLGHELRNLVGRLSSCTF